MHLFIDPTDVSLNSAQFCKQQLLIISGITPYCQTFSVLDYVNLIQFLYDIYFNLTLHVYYLCMCNTTDNLVQVQVQDCSTTSTDHIIYSRTDSTLVIYVKSFVIYC